MGEQFKVSHQLPLFCIGKTEPWSEKKWDLTTGINKWFADERMGLFLCGQSEVGRGRRGEIERYDQEKQKLCRDAGKSSGI